MFKSTQKIIFVGLFLFSIQIYAQTNLDEVVVTANKSEQKLSQTGKVITILGDSILQKFHGHTVSELLARQVGFNIVGAYGPLGSNQELYVRGAGHGNTLVLIDGVPIYDPSYISSGFDLNMISLADCDRIEILKGSQSTLYGSDAVAGVINIFTKKGTTTKPLATNISLNGGSFKTSQHAVGIHGLLDRFYYNVQYSNLQSEGISAAYNKELLQSPSVHFPKIFEKDGINQNSLLANIGYNISDNLTVRFRGIHNVYKSDIDSGPYLDEQDYTANQKMSLLGSSIQFKTLANNLVFNYNFSKNNRTFIDDSLFNAPNYSKSYFGANTHFLELYFAKKWNKNIEYIFGADLRSTNLEQTYRTVSAWGPFEAAPIGKDTTDSNIISMYGSTLINAAKFFFEIGGRFNMHNIYGNNFTYSLSPSIMISKSIKTFVNFSSGFKAPSLYQLFSQYGNKNLKPEQTVSAELGLQYASKNRSSNLRILYFFRNQKEVIFFQNLTVEPWGNYINFDKQNDQGLEFEANTKLSKFNFWANFTYLNGKITTEEKGKSVSYNNLFRRPKTQYNFGLGYQPSTKLYFATSLKNLGKRTDRIYNELTFSTDNVILEAYSVWDFLLEYKINRSLKLTGNIGNITNKIYFDSVGYSTKPFNFRVGIQLQF